MIEEEGDIWETDAVALVITTNGVTRRDGNAVMGRGLARQARDRYSDLDASLGAMLRVGGNHVWHLGAFLLNRGTPDQRPVNLVSFPVKEHWKERARLDLIERSAKELVELTDMIGWQTVALTRPGCGNGGLSWESVRPILLPLLDDRFTIYYQNS